MTQANWQYSPKTQPHDRPIEAWSNDTDGITVRHFWGTFRVYRGDEEIGTIEEFFGTTPLDWFDKNGIVAPAGGMAAETLNLARIQRDCAGAVVVLNGTTLGTVEDVFGEQTLRRFHERFVKNQ